MPFRNPTNLHHFDMKFCDNRWNVSNFEMRGHEDTHGYTDIQEHEDTHGYTDIQEHEDTHGYTDIQEHEDTFTD
jgi:hypothetical protein